MPTERARSPRRFRRWPRPGRVGLVVLALASAAAVSATPDAALEVTVPDAAVSVGDRIPVRVVARGGDDLLWGALRVSVEADGDWAVVDGPREVPGARPPAWELTLAPLATGARPLPPLRATVRDGAGGEPREVAATGVSEVEVASVLPPGEEPEPAPLADPIGVRGFPWEWVGPLAVLAALLGGAGWWLWRRRSRRDAAGGVGRAALPPLAELEGLARELGERLGREPSDAVCDRLAHGLRRYLERRTGEPAGEMTSFELRLLGRRLGWPDDVRRTVQAVMAVADRVRFGRSPSSEDELREGIGAAVDAARRLERHLAPPEDAPREAVG